MNILDRIDLFAKERIIWPIQRFFRDYADCDLWGLDYHLARIILKHLKAFQKMPKIGTPIFKNEIIFDNENNIKKLNEEETEKKDNERIKRWNDIIDSMIFAFEFVLKDFGNDYEGVWTVVKKGDPKAPIGIPCEDDSNCSTFNPEWLGELKHNEKLHDELYEKYQTGMKNFIEYFGNLWD